MLYCIYHRMKYNMKHIISKEQKLSAIKSSVSIAEALRKLGIKDQGGNYRIINSFIKENNIDVSHMKNQAHNKGKKLGYKRDISEYLLNNRKIQSFKLHKRLIKEGLFRPVCSICKNTEWNFLPIPLELDHINGVNSDNTLSNLRLVCPNCHAQTNTYRGKNKKK